MKKIATVALVLAFSFATLVYVVAQFVPVYITIDEPQTNTADAVRDGTLYSTETLYEPYGQPDDNGSNLLCLHVTVKTDRDQNIVFVVYHWENGANVVTERATQRTTLTHGQNGTFHTASAKFCGLSNTRQYTVLAHAK